MIAWILMVEHWEEYDQCFSQYNINVFVNEEDCIRFVNEHSPIEFSAYDGDKPSFVVDIIGVNTGDLCNPSAELEAAVDAANER